MSHDVEVLNQVRGQMIAIVDYRAGNLTSVRLAFEALKRDCVITNDVSAITSAERVVFPGVGSAGSAMANLKELDLLGVLRDVVAQGKPFLGICLGTQVIFESLEEDGGVQGLGLIPGNVRRFRPSSRFDKVPQMGWNAVSLERVHPVFKGIEDGSEFYFVHSYYPDPSDRNVVLGTTEYADVRFASVVGSGNVVATQFHPEKSGRIGLRLFENFSEWDGTC